MQQSDAQGKFRFLNLYPGAYALKAELEGFSTVERPDLTIKLGGKANIEITLTGAVKDVITVTGESPLLDERKIDQGTNVSTVELDKVPTARDPWSLLSQAPGVLVDRVNVGGNESGQQSRLHRRRLQRPRQHLRGRRRGAHRHERGGRLGHLLRLRGLRGGPVHGLERRRHRPDLGRDDQPGDQARHQRVAGERALPGHRRQPAGEAAAARRQQDRQGRGVRRRRRRPADQGPPVDLGRLRRQRHPQHRPGRAARQDQARGLQRQAELPGRARTTRASSTTGPTTSSSSAAAPAPTASRRRPTTRPRRRTSTRSRTPSWPPRTGRSPASGRATPASSPSLPRAGSRPTSSSTPTASTAAPTTTSSRTRRSTRSGSTPATSSTPAPPATS